MAALAPEQGHRQVDRWAEAADLDRGALAAGERAGDDAGAEADRDEAAEQEGVAALERDRHPLAGVGDPLLESPVDRRAAARDRDRLGGEALGADRAAARRAARREDRDQLVLAEDLGDDAFGRLAGEQGEGGVDLVLLEVAGHVGGRPLAQADLDSGVGGGEPGEQAGHVELARGQQGADRDPAADEALELVDLVAHAVNLGEHAPRARGDRLPRLGRRDAAARALEELGAELGLEPADLVRERGLGDVELLGRAGEVAVAGDRVDISELA